MFTLHLFINILKIHTHRLIRSSTMGSVSFYRNACRFRFIVLDIDSPSLDDGGLLLMQMNSIDSAVAIQLLKPITSAHNCYNIYVPLTFYQFVLFLANPICCLNNNHQQ